MPSGGRGPSGRVPGHPSWVQGLGAAPSRPVAAPAGTVVVGRSRTRGFRGPFGRPGRSRLPPDVELRVEAVAELALGSSGNFRFCRSLLGSSPDGVDRKRL